ncbi:MAG: lactate 2-monooxygenase [Saprospiraceae bacterium]|jgi:lactate 2-monooxygenase
MDTKKPSYTPAPQRQGAIYVKGAMGAKPIVPFDPIKLEAQAKEKMNIEAAGYIIGGAGTDDTIRENRAAFSKYRILPRMFKDVSVRNTSVDLFNRTIPSPMLTAPIGVLEMIHEDAGKAVGRATSKLGIPMIISNQASYSMEEISEGMGDGPRWFQLYWSKSDELIKSLVQRAEKSDCDAIAVTLDTTMLGWRVQDLDLMHLPFLKGQGIAQYTSDPVFNEIVAEMDFEEESMRVPGVDPATFKAVMAFTGVYSRPSITWKDLEYLRSITDLPILLKGILHPEDGALAVKHGVDGIIVSNHGGRQVDGAIAAIDALSGVVDAVRKAGSDMPILMDSGIRTGADIFKAIALGAKAVCIGRPYAYGLALAGQEGVEEVLSNLMAEFEFTMALSGCKNVEEIGRHCLV